MQLSRNFTDKETIRRAEERVAWYKKSVGRYQEIARGGKEGVAAMLVLLKDMRDTARRLKDDCLARPSFGKFMRSTGYAADERAYSFVIDLFENPAAQMAPWKRQLEEAEKELSDLRKLPTRE